MTWRTAVVVALGVWWGGAMGIVYLAQMPTLAHCYAIHGCFFDREDQP